MWPFWLIASAVFFVAEIFTTGFLIFWFGIGALAALLVSFFTANLFIQSIVFIAVSTILLIFTSCDFEIRTKSLSDKISSSS